MSRDGEWLQSSLDALGFSVLRSERYGEFLLRKSVVVERGDLLELTGTVIQRDGGTAELRAIQILKLETAGLNGLELIDEHGNVITITAFDSRRAGTRAYRTAIQRYHRRRALARRAVEAAQMEVR